MKRILYRSAIFLGIIAVVCVVYFGVVFATGTWTQQTIPGVSGVSGWAGIAGSSDGAKLAAIEENGLLWTSTDSGVTWTSHSDAGSQRWKSISSSADGSVLAAGIDGDDIWTSTDSGATWTNQTNSGLLGWYGITLSSDGQKMAAVDHYQGDVYTSTDAGVHWTDRGNNYSGKNWGQMSASADGLHVAAIDLTNFPSATIVTSDDGGNTWTVRSSAGARRWRAVAYSADASILIAAVAQGGDIYTSTDHGATWTDQTIAGSRDWQAAAAASNGSLLAAAAYAGNIYTSTTSGATWTVNSSAGSRTWQELAMSADGTHLAATPADGSTNGDIWTSSDSGATWTDRAVAGSRRWIGLAFSSDGSKVVATDRGNGIDNGDIYTSSDEGVTWTKQNATDGHNWFNVTMSSDGSVLYVIANGPGATTQQIWKSTDSGVNWTMIPEAQNRSWWAALAATPDGATLYADTGLGGQGSIWKTSDGGSTWGTHMSPQGVYLMAIAGSADGSKLITVDEGHLQNKGDIYTSTDSGATWTGHIVSEGPQYWTAITSSADGTKFAAASGDNYIWTSTDSGATWTKRTQPGNGFFQTISSSADGSTIVAGDSGASVWISTDAGANWTQQTDPGNLGWTGSFSSADGSFLAMSENYNGDIWTYANVAATLPTVSSSAASSLTGTSAVLSGSIDATGGANPTSRGFVYGATAQYGATTTESGSFSTGSFSTSTSSLTCGTTYHFASYAINSAGLGYSPDSTFSTSACPTAPPPISTGNGPPIMNPPPPSPPPSPSPIPAPPPAPAKKPSPSPKPAPSPKPVTPTPTPVPKPVPKPTPPPVPTLEPKLDKPIGGEGTTTAPGLGKNNSLDVTSGLTSSCLRVFSWGSIPNVMKIYRTIGNGVEVQIATVNKKTNWFIDTATIPVGVDIKYRFMFPPSSDATVVFTATQLAACAGIPQAQISTSTTTVSATTSANTIAVATTTATSSEAAAVTTTASLNPAETPVVIGGTNNGTIVASDIDHDGNKEEIVNGIYEDPDGSSVPVAISTDGTFVDTNNSGQPDVIVHNDGSSAPVRRVDSVYIAPSESLLRVYAIDSNAKYDVRISQIAGAATPFLIATTIQPFQLVPNIELPMIAQKTMASVAIIGGIASAMLDSTGIPFELAQIYRIIAHLIINLLEYFGLRKKRKAWGTVYDAASKEPIDPALLELIDANGKVVDRAITDLDGRYGFIAVPGVYTIRAQKSNYEFPSKRLFGKERDVLYEELYFGGPFQFAGGAIVKNIPMDRLIAIDWNQSEKLKKHMMRYSSFDPYIARSLDLIFYGGIAVLIWQFLSRPSVFLGAIFAFYVAIMVVHRISGRPPLFGVVQDSSGTPLSFGVVHVFSSAGIEIAKKVLDVNGRYFVLVSDGAYKIIIERRTGEETLQPVIEKTITARKGVINLNVTI